MSSGGLASRSRDAGLIKVDATGLQKIKLAASSDLETGTEVVSIGYPGKVKDVTDEDYAPSYKDGQINSRKTIGQGILTVYEVSTGMAGGMSGGPTVNLAGDVVGFNSFGATAETEQFNFVGPTSMVKELLADAGIKNDLGSLSKNYHAGLDAYFELTLRRAGRLHHLGVGIIHTRKRVLMVIDNLEVTLTEQTTGEILGQYDINPDRNYWPKKQGTPAKGRGSPI